MNVKHKPVGFKLDIHDALMLRKNNVASEQAGSTMFLSILVARKSIRNIKVDL